MKCTLTNIREDKNNVLDMPILITQLLLKTSQIYEPPDLLEPDDTRTKHKCPQLTKIITLINKQGDKRMSYAYPDDPI